MIQIHNIKQGSEEWLDVRMGRVGGSECSPFFASMAKGAQLTTGLNTLAYKKASEIVLGAQNQGYQSDAMMRGHRFEPYARDEYEDVTGFVTSEVGYISKADFWGYSPDGLVGDDGLLEIKCPLGPEFFRLIHTKKIKSEYIAQMQWAMMISGREWCDFVGYHPELSHKTLIKRIEYQENEIVLARMELFSTLVQGLVESMKEQQPEFL